MSLITIKSKSASFRRAGIEFTRAGVEVEADELTEEQLGALSAEPNLTFVIDTSELTQDQVNTFVAEERQPAGGFSFIGGKKPEPVADGEGKKTLEPAATSTTTKKPAKGKKEPKA